MPSFLENSRRTQDTKRAGRGEKDPADLSGVQEPDWDNPQTWGGAVGSASNSASGNAGDPAGEKERQHADAADPEASRAPKVPRRPPRRRGRPRGPERAMLSVRILAENDRRLTLAVEQTGQNPQSLVDQALDTLFKRLKIQDPGPEEGAA